VQLAMAISVGLAGSVGHGANASVSLGANGGNSPADPVVFSTFYFDNVAGNDSNNGSQGSPWATMAKAIANFAPARIFVGINNGATNPYRELHYVADKNGSPLSPITLKGNSNLYLAGSEIQANWTDVSGVWEATAGGAWTGLWACSNTEWTDGVGGDSAKSGILAPSYRTPKDTSDPTTLAAGEWVYINPKVHYKPKAGETPSNTHVEASISQVPIGIKRSSYLIFEDMTVALSASTAFGAEDNWSYLTIKDSHMQHVRLGVTCKEGSHIVLDNLDIFDTRNGGIFVGGSEEVPVNNTLIQNCEIGRVAANDGIAWHHSGYPWYNIGSYHRAYNNLVYDCEEQGFDITAGDDILLRGNTTRNNRLNTITFGHYPENVSVYDHISVDDGVDGAGLQIGDCTTVLIDNLTQTNAGRFDVNVSGDATDVIIQNSTFTQGAQTSRGYRIAITKEIPYDPTPTAGSNGLPPRGYVQNIAFNNNTFTGGETDELNCKFRYVPDVTTVSFDGNTWKTTGVVSLPYNITIGPGDSTNYTVAQMASNFGVVITDDTQTTI
jgi:hypothetical protein